VFGGGRLEIAMTGRSTPSERLNKEGIIKIEVPIKRVYTNGQFEWLRFLRPEFFGSK